MASDSSNPLSSSSLPPLMISAISLRPGSVSPLASAPVAVPESAEKPNCSISANIIGQDDYQTLTSHIAASEDQSHPLAGQSAIQFTELPVEIHEVILDQIFGKRASLSNHSAHGQSSAQNWSKALHHPRRKALSDLALTCRMWTGLVQSRIYRHSEFYLTVNLKFNAIVLMSSLYLVKIKGTNRELIKCVWWFKRNSHLAPYVCHIEIWMPIWGNRAVRPNDARSNAEQNGTHATEHVVDMQTNHDHNHGDVIFRYHRATGNTSLEEIFWLIQYLFPTARVLTLEGGHCKNAPIVRHSRYREAMNGRNLPVLGQIQTLIMRGAWNLMRQVDDWGNISQALPALSEWHCDWVQPHLCAYLIMMSIFIDTPPTIRHINLGLEEFSNASNRLLSALFRSQSAPPPICTLLGEAIPRFESFTYSGRVCWYLFKKLKEGATEMESGSPLRSLDLSVKTCCHNQKVDGLNHWTQTSYGTRPITSIAFIRDFEAMVVKAIECLSVLPALEYLRIRFINLDSSCPPLNPYFELVNNECTGLWSDDILEALRVNRPSAMFFALTDGTGNEYDDQQMLGALMPQPRPLGIQLNSYSLLADTSSPY